MNRPKGFQPQDAHHQWALRDLPLPGHVIVLSESAWHRGWLLAKENGPTGWLGLVQYEEGGREVTEYLPAEQIVSPDLWLPE